MQRVGSVAEKGRQGRHRDGPVVPCQEGREKSAVVSASVGTRSVLRASVKGSLGESSGQGDITCGVFHPNKGETCQSRLPATDRRAAAVVGPTEPRGLPRFCATGDGLLPPEVVLSKRLPPPDWTPTSVDLAGEAVWAALLGACMKHPCVQFPSSRSNGTFLASRRWV